MSESVITVKNRHLAASIEALNVLGKIEEGALGAQKVQKLSRWLRKIGNAIDDFQKGERAMFKAHWKKIEGALSARFEPEDPHKFGAAQEEYGDATTEIRVPRLTLDWFEGKAKLTAGQIATLDWWIDLAGDDEP